jgi:hypothetical protein
MQPTMSRICQGADLCKGINFKATSGGQIWWERTLQDKQHQGSWAGTFCLQLVCCRASHLEYVVVARGLEAGHKALVIPNLAEEL